MSHASRLYLDHPYEHDNRESGLSWATGSISTRDVFNYHLPPASSTARLSLPLVQRLCRTYDATKCVNLSRPVNVVGTSVTESGAKRCLHREKEEES